MQRGFLQGAHSRSEKKPESEHLGRLQAALSAAELELRKRRKARLELEAQTLTTDGPASSTITPDQLPIVAPDEAALHALASHDEPPTMLHRLAVALMLLLESPLLIDLGEHRLPTRVPWKNLQLLLRKPWGQEEVPDKKGPGEKQTITKTVKPVATALCQQPYGRRLALHVQQQILGGDPPLTQAEVDEADGRCAVLLDWVQGLVLPVVGSCKDTSRNKEATAAVGAVLADVPEEVKAAREAASTAIAEQEQEVADLRKDLQEARRSEEAAKKFAAENDPSKHCLSEHSTDAAGKKEDAAVEVQGQKQLQYRLQEFEVPLLQESVLISLINSVMEPRAGKQRQVEIIGRCEDREADETAQQRAEAVQAFLLSSGVPLDRMSMRWVVGGPSSCRRTDLCMTGAVGSDSAVRQRAADLMQKVFSQAGHQAEAVPSASSTAKLTEQAAAIHPAAPSVVVEELAAESSQQSSTCRRVRVVFTKAGLTSKGVDLEIGTDAVRLSSLSGDWGELEVPLPFAVEQPTEQSAKFSKRAGTLTVTLVAA